MVTYWRAHLDGSLFEGCFLFGGNIGYYKGNVGLFGAHLRSAKRVPKGTAPELFWPQMARLSTKKMPKTKPGYTIAVKSEFSLTF